MGLMLLLLLLPRIHRVDLSGPNVTKDRLSSSTVHGGVRVVASFVLRGSTPTLEFWRASLATDLKRGGLRR